MHYEVWKGGAGGGARMETGATEGAPRKELRITAAINICLSVKFVKCYVKHILLICEKLEAVGGKGRMKEEAGVTATAIAASCWMAGMDGWMCLDAASFLGYVAPRLSTYLP